MGTKRGESKTGQPQRKINFYGKLAVACACVCIITMSSVGVHAAINYANQRMEQFRLPKLFMVSGYIVYFWTLVFIAKMLWSALGHSIFYTICNQIISHDII